MRLLKVRRFKTSLLLRPGRLKSTRSDFGIFGHMWCRCSVSIPPCPACRVSIIRTCSLWEDCRQLGMIKLARTQKADKPTPYPENYRKLLQLDVPIELLFVGCCLRFAFWSFETPWIWSGKLCQHNSCRMERSFGRLVQGKQRPVPNKKGILLHLARIPLLLIRHLKKWSYWS